MLTTHHTPGPAPEVVLLHGVFMDSGLWHGVTPLLPVATTTVDLPGHGRSPAPRPDATLDDLHEVLRSRRGTVTTVGLNQLRQLEVAVVTG